MITIIAGMETVLTAQFLDPSGVLADPSLPVTLTITPVTGPPAVLQTTDLEHPATGVFTYAWTPANVEAATDYVATWDAAGAGDTPAAETIRVVPAVAGTWATVADVLAITGITVTESTLAVASNMIETWTGAYVDMPADSIGARDRRVLTRATSWQAAWLANKPGVITEREGSSSVSADTVRVERRMAAEEMLAPMAIREIKNLSWVGTRTLWLPPVSTRRRLWEEINFLNEASDPVWLGN